MKKKGTEYAIVHVSDWTRNYQDKYYEAPLAFIIELRLKIKSYGIETAWGWWVGKVDYGEKVSTQDNPIKYGKVDMTLNEFFLDYTNPIESVDEWEF